MVNLKGFVNSLKAERLSEMTIKNYEYEVELMLTLKFGMAVKMSGQWTYVITKQKFEEITGIKV